MGGTANALNSVTEVEHFSASVCDQWTINRSTETVKAVGDASKISKSSKIAEIKGSEESVNKQKNPTMEESDKDAIDLQKCHQLTSS